MGSAAPGAEKAGADLAATVGLDQLAGGVQDVALLLRQVVVHHLAQLLEGLGELVTVEVVELEDRQEGLVDLGVLLLAVLDLVLDVVLALRIRLSFEDRVDDVLLGLGMGDQQVGELGPHRDAVLRVVAQQAQQAFHLFVVGEDQVDGIRVVDGASTAVGEVGHGFAPGDGRVRIVCRRARFARRTNPFRSILGIPTRIIRMSNDLHTTVRDRLRRSRQRYTSGRQALVGLLLGSGRPMTITDLLDTGADQSQSSLYRNLAILEQCGVVRRLSSVDDLARYELDEELTGHHHHHLVCTDCGRVDDVTFPDDFEASLSRAAEGVVDRHGYRLDAHHLELTGVCGDCDRVG